MFVICIGGETLLWLL